MICRLSSPGHRQGVGRKTEFIGAGGRCHIGAKAGAKVVEQLGERLLGKRHVVSLRECQHQAAIGTGPEHRLALPWPITQTSRARLHGEEPRHARGDRLFGVVRSAAQQWRPLGLPVQQHPRKQAGTRLLSTTIGIVQQLGNGFPQTDEPRVRQLNRDRALSCHQLRIGR